MDILCQLFWILAKQSSGSSNLYPQSEISSRLPRSRSSAFPRFDGNISRSPKFHQTLVSMLSTKPKVSVNSAPLATSLIILCGPNSSPLVRLRWPVSRPVHLQCKQEFGFQTAEFQPTARRWFELNNMRSGLNTSRDLESFLSLAKDLHSNLCVQ